MYGFRKPFTVAEHSETIFWGIHYKTILITMQVLGYTLAKFLGIKIIAEMPPHRRAIWFLILIGLAQVSLLLLALTPAPWNALWLFSNGLALGMVFGLVLGFLEGRQQTEALAAGLCVSFIVADGVVKSVGAEVMRWGVPIPWMPFVTGLLFLLPQIFFIWMLSQIPPPTEVDISLRSQRSIMDKTARDQFFWRYAGGLLGILVMYVLCTILRSLRADFAPELWRGLGITGSPSIFTQSEGIVGLVLLFLVGTTCFIQNNRLAFFTGLSLAILGFAVLLLSLQLQSKGVLSPLSFMVLVGVGLYLPYMVVHTTLFERLLALTREPGNVGYLMYLVDAFGYLGYVLIMFLRQTIQPGENFLDYFLLLAWLAGWISLVLLITAWHYFARHPRTQLVPSSN